VPEPDPAQEAESAPEAGTNFGRGHEQSINKKNHKTKVKSIQAAEDGIPNPN